MLTKLRFKNFKAWKDSGDIRLAPLTVLFGTNSAGKTSIPQLLLMLKQTADSPDRQRALQMGDSRTLVDLGTFEDALHNHDVSHKLEIDLDWNLNEPLQISDPLTKKKFEGSEMSLHVCISAGKNRQPVVSEVRYELKSGGAIQVDIEMKRKSNKNKYDVASPHSNYKLTRHSGRVWPVSEPVRFYGFPDEVAAYFQNAMFATDFVLQFEKMLRSIFYVGPLRETPKRLYMWSGEVPDHVGTKGDRAIEAILAAGDRRFNLKEKSRSRQLAELVAAWLKKIGMIRDFRVKPLGDGRKEYEVLVRTGPKMAEVKLTDVGFGVSQLLPVLVESFFVPPRSIMIFEQPEIHLHPRVQAEMADLFIEAVKMREDGKPRDCQFIIESHSEHFLRRLQRRIAEEELTADQAALYFVHTEDGAARLEPLDVDPYGNIRNWPENFFGDEMEDLVARSEAQAKRMAAQQAPQDGGRQ
ncbi:MAG TPA: DUF3696 domain-containing protein [Candidatus Ozemobacteraceae bacterium]|nr:DUF3696 domain-containing protein [Candidatus Ozemobacteraceae bacterium]